MPSKIDEYAALAIARGGTVGRTVIATLPSAPPIAPADAWLPMPYPPTTNNLFVTAGNKRIKSREYRAFLAAVKGRLGGRAKHAGRLAVTIHVHPPDKRRRDIDNVLKATLDALTHAGVYADDSQIDRLVVERKSASPTHGGISVRIELFAPEES